MINLQEKIKPLVEEITFKSITYSEALYTTGLIDSMGTIDLAMLLESEFNLKIDTRDIIESNFDSIEKLALYIGKRLG